MGRTEIVAAIASQLLPLREEGVEHVALFGSRARGEAKPDSDLDVLIDIAPGKRFSLLNLSGVGLLIEEATGIPTQVVLRRSIPPEFAQRIANDLIPVMPPNLRDRVSHILNAIKQIEANTQGLSCRAAGGQAGYGPGGSRSMSKGTSRDLLHERRRDERNRSQACCRSRRDPAEEVAPCEGPQNGAVDSCRAMRLRVRIKLVRHRRYPVFGKRAI
jgi:uncharacterized protein